MEGLAPLPLLTRGFSALQRAEIAEIDLDGYVVNYLRGFSALQRAEIAEIWLAVMRVSNSTIVSVLFNEPKLLKFWHTDVGIY